MKHISPVIFTCLFAVVVTGFYYLVRNSGQTNKLPNDSPNSLHTTQFSSKISSVAAVKIINELPEIQKEIGILLGQKAKPATFVESQPTSDSFYYRVSFSSIRPDKKIKLVSFLVHADTGEVMIEDDQLSKTITYSEWQKSCQLQSCQQ